MPTVCVPKFTGDGDIVISVPLPLTGITCGLPQASSITVTEAFRFPNAEGLKVSVMVQLAPTPRLDPQVFDVNWKSTEFVPPSAMLVIVSDTCPTLVSFSVIAALVVFNSWLGNARLAGENPSFGAPLYLAVAVVAPSDMLQPNWTFEKLPVSDEYVMTGNVVPIVGLNPLTRHNVAVPASVAAPLMFKTSI